MILIISTCADKLSELEFVRPLQQLVGGNKARHYRDVTPQDIARAERIIITGTALKDFDYLKHDWLWLKTVDKPVLGICAGMQVIAQAFGVPLQDCTSIGPQGVTTIKENKLTKGRFTAYFLHTKTCNEGLEVIATSKGRPCIVKHKTKEIYGCIFHPEVLNPEIIRRFAE